MEFLGDPVVAHGVVERRVDIPCEDRVVPAVVWTPADASGARPLVLIGHGGTGHKRMDYVLALARRLTRHRGFAVAAIDGPGHGDRKGAVDRKTWMSKPVIESMNADWKATRAALADLPEVGDGPLGYWGLSMGTMFGVPFVASEPSVRVAVLGLGGAIGQRYTASAADIRCPVLFLQQLDDELVPRASALELFLAIGSADKRLHAHPGPHIAVPPEEFEQSEAFLAQHLEA
ncbi:MAG TPA: dienelactone hydrolase family protein [Acidimicrobiales bacterium]|nr:dienelactone hydrolase family protein [Acidimicrobiales bacterium]